MKLSRQYRMIIASFDMSLDYHRPLAESFQEGSGEWDTAFWVMPFEYEVLFRRHISKEDYQSGKNIEDTNEYEVLFKISDMEFSSDEEMIQAASKITGRPVKDADQAKLYLRSIDKFGLTNLGQSRPVLSGVLGAIRQFVSQYKPSCLVFDAYEPKRQEFYRFLVNKLSKTMGFQHSSDMKSSSRKFRVCLNKVG